MPKPKGNQREKRIKIAMWKAEIKDKIRDACRKLDEMKEEKLAAFEFEFRSALMALPKHVLDAPVDLNDEKFKAFILGTKDEASVEGIGGNPPAASRNTVRRRSRSVSTIKFSARSPQRSHRQRSTSVDIYQTPRGRVRLSTIMSQKKYTVTKPRRAQNSGLHVKRIMKPDEEAISTCGSPLYVASCNLGAPHVNIPLPGGVVLNIEPKSPTGPLDLPTLDPKTKSQIRLLYQQLKTLF